MGSITDFSDSVDTRLSSLTLDEKISLLAGKNFWETIDIPGKAIPSLKTSDGPNGVRGNSFDGEATAACFPASVLLASTWDLQLARKVGIALAEEAHTKGARVLLAPTVCPHRHPLGGRNFESFSEDPFLAGKLAAQYIIGLQENDVGATVKHYACNEQETDRFNVNATISERALREIYLKPFEIAIKEGQPWAVMTSYNQVNGVHSDMSDFLLQKVLRADWGWDGLVMSDWYGTNSTAQSINAGLDLEMPGPARYRTTDKVRAAIELGLVSEKTIDKRCRNVLHLLERANCFNRPIPPDEQAYDSPLHRRLIREVGASGIVLLKNERNILPLKRDDLRGKRVTLLGFAKEALIHGGGSASVKAHYEVTPWDGLSSALGPEVELVYSKGAHTIRLLPAMKDDVVDNIGNPGWTLRGYESSNFSGGPVIAKNIPNASWCPVLEVSTSNAAIITGVYKPAREGLHYLGFSGVGPSQLYINGSLLFEQKGQLNDPVSFLLGNSTEDVFQMQFEKDKSYEVEIRTWRSKTSGEPSPIGNLIGVHLGFMTDVEYDEDVRAVAVAEAKDADVVIIFSGHTAQWEGEGKDQDAFSLPARGSQDLLIENVSRVNRNVIVVNSTGTPIAMPWADNVSAILQSWFPGQEAGNSIADVLTGAVNPSGRLPVSFPRSIEDTPAFGNFPGSMQKGQREVRYAEGIYVGYRHYDKEDPDMVLFPFGFGLSYTTFWITSIQVRSFERDSIDIRVNSSNTGQMAGHLVIQIYTGRAGHSRIDRPLKQLAGFSKVFLNPGETKEANISLSVESLAYFDESRGFWVVESGDYNIWAGSSSRDITSVSRITLDEELVFSP